MYSNRSEPAYLDDDKERLHPVWSKHNLNSNNTLIKNGDKPLKLCKPNLTPLDLETSLIEDYATELRTRKPDFIGMPEVLGNFKIENLLGIGIYIDGLEWYKRLADFTAIGNQLDNVRKFYEFLISKSIFVPLTIYTATKEHPGELEIFTDWKSFEAAALAAIDRLKDESD